MTAPLNQTEARDEARRRTAAVADDPAQRLALRQDFYRKYGGNLPTPYGYGASELAFIGWEIERGVLASVGGSPWWRAVNAAIAVEAEEARLLYENGRRGGSSIGVDAWARYIEAPGNVSWYRAHNSSVVGGYLANEALARDESQVEQRFMSTVLYRVLFAQSMVEGKDPNASLLERLFEELERTIADPALFAVDAIVHVPAFYPAHYPMTEEEGEYVDEKHLSLQGVVEVGFDLVILAHAKNLYARCAERLGIPELESLLDDGRPVYPRVVE